MSNAIFLFHGTFGKCARKDITSMTKKPEIVFCFFWVVFVCIGIIVNLMGVQIKLMHNTSLSIDHYVSVNYKGLRKMDFLCKTCCCIRKNDSQVFLNKV